MAGARVAPRPEDARLGQPCLAELAEKLGVERPPYRILGACNPVLADQALQLEPNIGLLLPCNVVVRDAGDGRFVVAFMDPETVLGLVERPELASLGSAAKQRLQRVCAGLTP